jgi:N-terminal domain of argonaute
LEKVEFLLDYSDTDREQPRITKFKIEIQPTGEIDLSAVDTYIKEGSSVNTPSQAIQALDIALKNVAVNRFRSIFL